MWGLLLVVGCDGARSAAPVSESDVAETKKRGEAVVAVIEEYHTAKKKYPATLEELPPELKAKMQQPTVWDKRWTYGTSPDGGYILQVAQSPAMSPILAYNSDSKVWSAAGVTVK